MTATWAWGYRSDWRSIVGLPEDCTNPVFTAPYHMNPAGRVEGAGINMNDGEAYTNRSVDFSSEMHYAPKLPLCEQEKAVMPQVMGIFFNEKTMSPGVLEPLKFCVRVHHGCGAVVVYRAFDNYRYTNIHSENLEQFIAVYDDQGNLTDAMMMGYYNDLYDILGVEPHKDYKVGKASNNVEFDETGEHFTLISKIYLKEMGEGVPNHVEFARHYTITPEGKISLDKVTSNVETNVINPDAIEMMDLIYSPISASHLLSKLDMVWARLADNQLVGERMMHLGMMIYNRNPKSFLNYIYQNRTKTSLVTLLQRAKAYQGPGMEYDECITESIARTSINRLVKSWIFSKLKG